MRGLNPRQIEAFRAVVLTGSVSAAASLISVTQPAVSRMIRDLQHQLGRHSARLLLRRRSL